MYHTCQAQRGGAKFNINKRKEKQKTDEGLGYTNTICPFNISGNLPLFIFNYR